MFSVLIFKNIEEIINNGFIFDIKEQYKNILNSSIMKDNEFDMIRLEIEKRMKKKVKNVKKLYQATKDGDSVDIFHKKCDNIPNTIIFYKSCGNRRFGGFASQSWTQKEETIEDKNCFIFSLDKKKLYPPKNEFYTLGNYEYDGPSFCIGTIYLIEIENNKFLRTFEAGHKTIFDGDENALSEDGKFYGLNAIDYEVFEILF